MTVAELAQKLLLDPPARYRRRARARNRRRGDPPLQQSGRSTALVLEALCAAHSGLMVCLVAGTEGTRDALMRLAVRLADAAGLSRSANRNLSFGTGMPDLHSRHDLVLVDGAGVDEGADARKN